MRNAKTPTPNHNWLLWKDEDIVHTISNNRRIYAVGSPYPGGGEAAKGLAVR